MMLLQDRRDGGRKLAESLAAYKGRNCIVLGLPCGGVAVASEVAATLDAPMDLLLVKSIEAPRQPGLVVGTVMCGRLPVVVCDRDMLAITGTSHAQFERACQHVAAEIGRQYRFYCGERQPEALFGRTVIVVDDGLSNGDTMRAALRSVRQCAPQLLVMAVPVMPPGTQEDFQDEADAVVCVAMPNPFSSVQECYDDFDPITDQEVIQLLSVSPSAPHSPSQSRLSGSWHSSAV